MMSLLRQAGRGSAAKPTPLFQPTGMPNGGYGQYQPKDVSLEALRRALRGKDR
jgi:hypothetical protein